MSFAIQQFIGNKLEEVPWTTEDQTEALNEARYHAKTYPFTRVIEKGVRWFGFHGVVWAANEEDQEGWKKAVLATLTEADKQLPYFQEWVEELDNGEANGWQVEDREDFLRYNQIASESE